MRQGGWHCAVLARTIRSLALLRMTIFALRHSS